MFFLYQSIPKKKLFNFENRSTGFVSSKTSVIGTNTIEVTCTSRWECTLNSKDVFLKGFGHLSESAEHHKFRSL